MSKQNNQTRRDSINHNIEQLDMLITERQKAVDKYPDDGFMKLSLDTYVHQKETLKKQLVKVLKK
jgi:hypothetical protein